MEILNTELDFDVALGHYCGHVGEYFVIIKPFVNMTHWLVAGGKWIKRGGPVPEYQAIKDIEGVLKVSRSEQVVPMVTILGQKLPVSKNMSVCSGLFSAFIHESVDQESLLATVRFNGASIFKQHYESVEEAAEAINTFVRESLRDTLELAK